MAEKLALTREEFKKLRQTAESGQTQAPVQKTRAIPIWLRFVILVALMIIFATAGAVVGYSGMGHGKVIDIFKGSAFSHIYDLIEKK